MTGAGSPRPNAHRESRPPLPQQTPQSSFNKPRRHGTHIDTHYSNSTQVKAAGAAPLYARSPDHSSRLDHDGAACEN
ncbi:excalibur calcium-binding domain-containing protein [Corynebacterium sp. zg331]|uniref:excalibur calcium-binding domain-containing protein n=1 Tax=unclassified Corynebacterium TaxID=2624378 RepID=UPI00351B769E